MQNTRYESKHLAIMGVNASENDVMNLEYDRGAFKVNAEGNNVFVSTGSADSQTSSSGVSVFLGSIVGQSTFVPKVEAVAPSSLDRRTFSVSAGGSGEVCAGGLQGTTQTYFQGSILFNARGWAAVGATPYPRNQLAYWRVTEYPTGQESLFNAFPGSTGLPNAGCFSSAVAVFEPMTQLTFRVSSTGNDPPERVGYCRGNPAQDRYSKAYGPATGNMAWVGTGQVVVVSAVGIRHNVFKKWNGPGVAWKGRVDDPKPEDAVPLSSLTTTPITVRADENKTIESIFVPCPCGIEPETDRAPMPPVSVFADATMPPGNSMCDAKPGAGATSLVGFDARDVRYLDWEPYVEKSADGTCLWRVRVKNIRLGYRWTTCSGCTWSDALSKTEQCKATCVNRSFPVYRLIGTTGNCSPECVRRHEMYHIQYDVQKALEKVTPNNGCIDRVSLLVECGQTTSSVRPMLQSQLTTRGAAWCDAVIRETKEQGEIGAMCAQLSRVRGLTHTCSGDGCSEPCKACSDYGLVSRDKETIEKFHCP